jgi:hypothetical protein
MMQSMDAFDPEKACLVHDHFNDQTFEWKPEWSSSYKNTPNHRPGVISWDGLLLDGWSAAR